MKVATFNVNSLRKRIPIVLEWLQRHQPDVLCLQETKVQDSEFPLMALAPSGYEITYRGMKSYNGVAVLTRTKPDAVFYGFDDGGDTEEARLMRVVVGGVPIVNTYIPQGFEIDSPKYQYKLGWYDRLRRYFDRHLSPKEPAIWCGDMNVAPRPIDVHSPEKHLKHVCYHEDARKAYERTVAWGFEDVFCKLYPDRQQFTFWDYRAPSSLAANKGWRIDHILASLSMAAKCQKVEVDIEPRRAAEPSDHTFLWADFSL
ncbi:MAG: exodeoxyribonuclease III [Nitrospiraceae bacterium]|nr:exodeoxyribonuclease III [Nitrospiraceae bacterium]